LSTVGSKFFEISKSGYLCQRLSTQHLETILLQHKGLGLVNAVTFKMCTYYFLKNNSKPWIRIRKWSYLLSRLRC